MSIKGKGARAHAAKKASTGKKAPGFGKDDPIHERLQLIIRELKYEVREPAPPVRMVVQASGIPKRPPAIATRISGTPKGYIGTAKRLLHVAALVQADTVKLRDLDLAKRIRVPMVGLEQCLRWIADMDQPGHDYSPEALADYEARGLKTDDHWTFRFREAFALADKEFGHQLIQLAAEAAALAVVPTAPAPAQAQSAPGTVATAPATGEPGAPAPSGPGPVLKEGESTSNAKADDRSSVPALSPDIGRQLSEALARSTPWIRRQQDLRKRVESGDLSAWFEAKAEEISEYLSLTLPMIGMGNSQTDISAAAANRSARWRKELERKCRDIPGRYVLPTLRDDWVADLRTLMVFCHSMRIELADTNPTAASGIAPAIAQTGSADAPGADVAAKALVLATELAAPAAAAPATTPIVEPASPAAGPKLESIMPPQASGKSLEGFIGDFMRERRGLLRLQKEYKRVQNTVAYWYAGGDGPCPPSRDYLHWLRNGSKTADPEAQELFEAYAKLRGPRKKALHGLRAAARRLIPHAQQAGLDTTPLKTIADNATPTPEALAAVQKLLPRLVGPGVVLAPIPPQQPAKTPPPALPGAGLPPLEEAIVLVEYVAHEWAMIQAQVARVGLVYSKDCEPGFTAMMMALARFDALAARLQLVDKAYGLQVDAGPLDRLVRTHDGQFAEGAIRALRMIKADERRRQGTVLGATEADTPAKPKAELATDPANTPNADPVPLAADPEPKGPMAKIKEWHPIDFRDTVDPGMQQAIRLTFPNRNLPNDPAGPNWGIVREKLLNPGSGKTPKTPAEIDAMTMFDVQNAFNAFATDGTTRPIVTHTSEFSRIVQGRGRPAKPGEETQPAKKRTTDDDAKESAVIELEELPPRLSPKDQAVMLAMESFDAAQCPTISQIAEATNGAVSDKTTGDVVARFETLGFAERPGKRQGARLTTNPTSAVGVAKIFFGPT